MSKNTFSSSKPIPCWTQNNIKTIPKLKLTSTVSNFYCPQLPPFLLFPNIHKYSNTQNLFIHPHGKSCSYIWNNKVFSDCENCQQQLKCKIKWTYWIVGKRHTIRLGISPPSAHLREIIKIGLSSELFSHWNFLCFCALLCCMGGKRSEVEKMQTYTKHFAVSQNYEKHEKKTKLNFRMCWDFLWSWKLENRVEYNKKTSGNILKFPVFWISQAQIERKMKNFWQNSRGKKYK